MQIHAKALIASCRFGPQMACPGRVVSLTVRCGSHASRVGKKRKNRLLTLSVADHIGLNMAQIACPITGENEIHDKGNNHD